jgi:hypothetical protein
LNAELQDDDIPEVQKRPRPNSLDVSTPNPATSSLVIDIAQTVSQLPRERDEQVKTLFGSIYSYLVRKHQVSILSGSGYGTSSPSSFPPHIRRHYSRNSDALTPTPLPLRPATC